MPNEYSPSIVIGKHEWRIAYLESGYTLYEWRKIVPPEWTWRDDQWHSQDEWPRYDINDGTWGGLPHGIRRLYERERGSAQANRAEMRRNTAEQAANDFYAQLNRILGPLGPRVGSFE